MNNIQCVVMSGTCTGCSLCVNVCKKKAISFTLDEEGFSIPYVDNSKCSGCSICLSKCPSCNESTITEKITPKSYAVQASDTIRQNSSSGGAFYIIASYILSHNGYVCGAAFVDGKVKHIVISSIEQLYLLQYSKYVQSSMNEVWTDLHSALKSNREVLFVGVPCQVSAVKRIYKKISNLYTIDLFCMGVPSQYLLDRYLSEEFGNEKINEVYFRKKVNGWNQNHFLTVKTNENEYCLPWYESSYFTAFLKEYSLRNCCATCKYLKSEREADVTLGDFWNVGKGIDDKKGTSYLQVNTHKGESLINSIKKNFKLFVEQSPRMSQQYCMNTKHIRHGKRKEFFDLINIHSIKDSVNILNKEKSDVGIINYWYCNDHGAILTAYALQNLLFDNGISNRLINTCPDSYHEERKGGISEIFEYKHLVTTNRENFNSKNLNKMFRTFCVGSDQVFNSKWVPNEWFLNFADEEVNKVAVAASFGDDDFSSNDFRHLILKKCLKRFQSLSVREDSGVTLLNNIGCDSILLLDPVFLVDKKHYTDLKIDNALFFNNVFCYIRDLDPKLEDNIKKFAQKRNLNSFFVNSKVSIEEFITRISNASIVITDSYHGLCFSIIFNKNFICVKNNKSGIRRFSSIINLLDLNEENFVTSNSELSEFLQNSIEIPQISYTKINEKINNKKQSDVEWILNAIKNKVDHSSNVDEQKEFYKINALYDLMTKFVG